jgi:ubiquinone/menaquinone biosynthesis C-methylase UbiE
VIFVPTDVEVATVMLEAANLGPGDVVYDLGCGDGRIVITAARRFGARGVGVDIDPQRIREGQQNADHAGVSDRVTFIVQDLLVTDVSPATVVTLYLSRELNLRLRAKLLRELKPGSRIVSHDYDMDDWPPDRVIEVERPHLIRPHRVYLWRIPDGATGR